MFVLLTLIERSAYIVIRKYRVEIADKVAKACAEKRMRMHINIISWEQLQQYLGREDCLIIDLRDKGEYEEGHLPGALWWDWERLEEEIADILLAQHRNIETIILYCDRGNISLIAARDLARHGYRTASLGGGYERCGFRLPVERSQ